MIQKDKHMLKNARIWSNIELKRICKIFDAGDVINISGELDTDKQGGVYKDYFRGVNNYTVSNYNSCGYPGEVILDLEKELPGELCKAYDTVLCHNVIEHIYEIRTAISNLCKISKKVLIIVVPFIQEVHPAQKEIPNIDYWRPSPLALQRMFEENEFKMLYLSFNNMEFTNTYLLCIGVHKDFVKDYKKLDNRPHDYHAGAWVQKYGSEWAKGSRLKSKIKTGLFSALSFLGIHKSDK